LVPKWPWWLGRHPILALTATLVVWGLVDVRSRGRIDPDNLVEHRTDFTVYTEAGAASFDGRDPYTVTNARGWGYLYPPLFAIAVAPLASLDPQWQVTIWFFISLALLALCYRETTLLVEWLAGAEWLADRAEHRPTDAARLPEWIPWAAAIAAALPTLNCLQRGQVGVLQLYLLLLGFRLLMAAAKPIAWRTVLSGVVFALAIVIKITPALPVGLLLVERMSASRGQAGTGRRRQGAICAAGMTAGLVLWLLLVPAAAIGWQRNLDCLQRWCSVVPSKAIDAGSDPLSGDSYSVRNQSLVNSVRHFGNWIAEEFYAGPDILQAAGPSDRRRAMETPEVSGLLLIARLSVVALMIALAAWVGRRSDPLASAGVFALGLVATLVVSPVARTHYFLLLAPAVLLVPWHLYRRGQTRLAWWMAWTPTVLVVPHYFWPLAAGRVGWLGIGITAWLFTSGMLLWAGTQTGQSRAGLKIFAWRQIHPAVMPRAVTGGATTDQFASCRESAAWSAADESDPSES
jgi:Glycosyltransferase family 87